MTTHATTTRDRTTTTSGHFRAPERLQLLGAGGLELRPWATTCATCARRNRY